MLSCGGIGGINLFLLLGLLDELCAVRGVGLRLVAPAVHGPAGKKNGHKGRCRYTYFDPAHVGTPPYFIATSLVATCEVATTAP